MLISLFSQRQFTFCLATGNVDLSVGSVVCFSGAMLGFMTVTNNYPLWLAVLVIIISGAIGLFRNFDRIFWRSGFYSNTRW